MTRDLLGLCLLVAQAGMLLPLIGHTVRSKSAQGVALAGEAIWAVAGLGWMSYAAVAGDTAVLASGALAAAGSGCLTVLLWPRTTRTQRRDATLLALAVAIGLTVSAGAGPAGLAVGLSVFGIVQFWPQILTSVRALVRGEPCAGVTPVGAGLRAAYTTGWALYAGAWFWWGTAFSQIAWPLVIWGLMGMVAFATQSLAATPVSRRSASARCLLRSQPGEVAMTPSLRSVRPTCHWAVLEAGLPRHRPRRRRRRRPSHRASFEDQDDQHHPARRRPVHGGPHRGGVVSTGPGPPRRSPGPGIEDPLPHRPTDSG